MSLRQDRGIVLRNGIRDGIPIGMGYFAVSFSVGIACRNAGLNALQGFLISLLNNASAGEYAGLTVIAAGGTYLEMVLMMLVANARYMLMGCALSQRFSPETPLIHRLLVGFDLTDEIFGITVARPGYVDPLYVYGAMVLSMPGWALGTVLGVAAGNLMPPALTSAFSVALFGMFLSIIIPVGKKDRTVAVCVITGFASSYAAGWLPGLAALSSGGRTIVLTLVIAGAAAALRPIPDEEEEARNA